MQELCWRTCKRANQSGLTKSDMSKPLCTEWWKHCYGAGQESCGRHGNVANELEPPPFSLSRPMPELTCRPFVSVSSSGLDFLAHPSTVVDQSGGKFFCPVSSPCPDGLLGLFFLRYPLLALFGFADFSILSCPIPNPDQFHILFPTDSTIVRHTKCATSSCMYIQLHAKLFGCLTGMFCCCHKRTVGRARHFFGRDALLSFLTSVDALSCTRSSLLT